MFYSLGSLILFNQIQKIDLIKLKEAFGLLAIILNFLCAYFVIKKHEYFELGDESITIKFSKLLDEAGTLMILSIMLALAIGIFHVLLNAINKIG